MSSPEKPAAQQLVEKFWAAMNTNDFRQASLLLHPDYLLEWPQSGERIHGRENFTAINENYPAAGAWCFTINRLVVEGNTVVSDVSVTDGSVEARAITYSEVRAGLIRRQVEFWPDPIDAPAWRAPWVERL